jgi:hypothetical protein
MISQPAATYSTVVTSNFVTVNNAYNGFSIPAFDAKILGLSLTNNITSVTFKTGGLTGTTVAQLVYTFDANSNITSVVRY